MTAATRRALELFALAVVPLVGARHRPRDLRRPGPAGARLPRGGLSPGRGDRRRHEIRIRIPAAAITDTANAIWPIAAVLPAVPLTALSPAAADWIATFFVLACLVGALWMLGVRDWRIYGVTLLWPSVIDAYQTANVTLPLDAARGDHVAVSGSPCDRRASRSEWRWR